MLWYTHLLFSIVISRLLKINLILIIIGSLLPDIDNPESIIGTLFKRLSEKIYEKCNHRGLTHSLLFAAPLMVIPSLGIGVLSHLVLDLLTNNGVQLMYPSKNRYVLFGGSLKTGVHDTIASVVCLMVMILC